jgi:hypothetical protein
LDLESSNNVLISFEGEHEMPNKEGYALCLSTEILKKYNHGLKLIVILKQIL